MKKTLAIDSLFIQRYPTFLTELESALKLSIFDRCQFSIKSRNTDLLNIKDIDKLSSIINLSMKYCDDIVVSVACYEDYKNIDNNFAVSEANPKGSTIKLSRICPSNGLYRQKLTELISDVYGRFLSQENGIIHLAYFRYENINQCVCQNCLGKFLRYLSKKNIPFKFENYLSLLNHNIIAHWVHWRQDIIREALGEFSESCDKNISIEIDFDETKRYLAGPKIEEGLYLPKLTPYLNEIYLHIEPLKYKADFNFVGREKQRDSYLNHLKYIISRCKQSKVETHFFYWYLSDTNMIINNLKEYLPLAKVANPEGIIFYTNKPFELARILSEDWFLM